MLMRNQNRSKHSGVRIGVRQTLPHALPAYAGVHQNRRALRFYQITISAAAAGKRTEIKAHTASLVVSKINAIFIVPQMRSEM
jgi:hypothetical protein